jgi:two-component system OmpR family sensor kinase
MTRNLPIRLRLTLPFAIAMALVLAGMGLFVYLRVGSALLASVDQNLRAQLNDMKGHVEHGAKVADRDASGAATLGELVRSDGTAVDASPSTLVLLLSRPRLRSVLAGDTITWNAQAPPLRGRWRLIATAVQTEAGPAALVAGASLNARDEALDRLSRELLLGGPLALAVAVLAGYLVAAAALHPVEAMRARAAAITASTRSRRLPVPAPRDELARLAETLNDMLARLDAAFEHERRFVADASHELRTPLAMLRTELELALRRRRSRGELEASLRSAAEETERLSNLAEDLLLIARADQGKLPVRHERSDSGEIMHRVAERYATTAATANRSLAVGEDRAISVEADRERLEQALGNLVTNALAHGAGTVELSAREVGGDVEFHVRDEGPGFPPEFVPRAFDRFSRADDARGAGGTGLGLAIVELIAEAHGGSVGVGAADGSGADVWIRVPRSVAAGRPGRR